MVVFLPKTIDSIFCKINNCTDQRRNGFCYQFHHTFLPINLKSIYLLFLHQFLNCVSVCGLINAVSAEIPNDTGNIGCIPFLWCFDIWFIKSSIVLNWLEHCLQKIFKNTLIIMNLVSMFTQVLFSSITHCICHIYWSLVLALGNKLWIFCFPLCRIIVE